MGQALPSLNTPDSHLVLPPEAYALPAPHVVQGGCDNRGRDTQMVTTPVTVNILDNARVFFSGGPCLITDQDGQVHHRALVDDKQVSAAPWAHYRRLDGTVFLFGNSAGAHCYYHWMVDLMPKWGVLQKAGIGVDAIDHVLVRELASGFQRETFQRLGIPTDKIIEARNSHYFECERLVYVHMNNGINLKMNRFVPAWMRHQFLQTSPASVSGPVAAGPVTDANADHAPLKLYISRPKGVRRGVANEEALLPVLEHHGYTVRAMEGMSIAEQAALLARTEVLISPHGGALTNMLFSRPGIDVVELFGRHVYPFYYGLAALCGHNYHAILENPQEDYPQLVQFQRAQQRGSAKFQQQTRAKAFDVDPALLDATLAAIERH